MTGDARGAVERAVFGTADATEIAAAVGRATELVLGVALVDSFFASVSVGCVFGCELADGSRAVLKAHQPHASMRFLTDVQATQRVAVSSGLPGPHPVGSPTEVGQSETLHTPALAEHPMRRTPVGLYPAPHSPLFDFAATGAGAQWIDDIATRARALRDEARSSPVIAHTDWSLRNIRYRGSQVSAIYDWDSVALLPEAEAVGLAAAVYGLAYTARCEHCLDPDESEWATTRTALREAATLLR